jgi:uncharacterized protein Usg
VKCTRIYLPRANDAPSFNAYTKQGLWRFCSILPLSSVDLLKIRAFMWSTKLMPKASTVRRVHERIRLPLQWRKIIGESG